MTSVLKSFEERTRAQPNAIAVAFAGRRVTYDQLNERSRQIACALRASGVAAETLVAVYLDRSPELIAALLGVWKAGGAYLPIDPTNPRQRVAFTLEDSAVSYVLTEKSLADSLPPTAAKVLYIEDVSPEIPASAPEFGPVSPSQLAYVIYTSGSTGRPKGAGVCHSGLLNVVEAIGRDLELSPGNVVLATATIVFDISNLEIFVPLIAGATVHLMERYFAGDGPRLIEMIRSTNAAVVFGTPTSWRLMLEAGWKGSPDLQIITGGEVLPLSLAKTLTRMTRALWNHYGPTETSICATRERVLPEAEAVTLGWPIDNVRVYVLDQELRPMPTGEVGEIYIAGAGVGRGYLNRPELNARVFLPDPIAAAPGARMYKTGDLGRLLPDGRLDFQGRVDNQIKLRGFRIELEEIEAAICEFAGVHMAAVQLVEYGAGDQRLVAYFLGDFSDPQFAVAELRGFLRQRLPFYMLPSELIPIDSLPMTMNGKVDREALDAIRRKMEKQGLAEVASPPSDDLEAKLLAIWEKVLKLRQIAPTDDFFDLGGHSLLATRMFAEIEKTTGRRFPLSVLIQNPTVSELAAYIRSRPDMGWPSVVPIRDKGSLPPLFIAHGLGSNLLLFRALAEELGAEQPVYGIQLTAPVSALPEELTLEAFAARAVEDICAVDPVGPYYLAGHSLGGLLVFEIAAQLRERGKAVGLLILLDCDLRLAQRGENGPPPTPVALRDTWLRWRKKFSRLFESGMVITTWRKILYTQLMFKIWLLRKTYREGSFRPQLFGFDPYIALFAERYRPLTLDAEGVLFVAEDEVAPESAGLGWSKVLRGRLEIQKVPGSHQTIFTRPHVAVLARELTRRLDRSSKSALGESRPPQRERNASAMNPLLEFHGG